MLVSTRDPEQQPVSYSEAIMTGLAPDRGLYTPTDLPSIDMNFLDIIQYVSYPRQFDYIHGKCMTKDDIPYDQQLAIAEAAYSRRNFPNAREGIITPVTRLFTDHGGVYLQDLSGGPTAAFKDMALQPLGREMDYLLGRDQRYLSLLGATSGDTGSAAEAAVKFSPWMQIFMLSPRVGMAAFQAAQMGEQSGDNVFNVSIEGTFDDCQKLVKDIVDDPEFSDLGAVNSINFGRIAAQVPYYVAGYLQVVRKQRLRLDDPIDVVVPSGNFGNALAGHYARQMGLPIRNITLATNENDVLDRLVKTGTYENKGSRITSSPSMDISVSSNFERLLFEIMGYDPAKTLDYMHQFEAEKRVSFGDHGISNHVLLDMGFRSASSSHQDRLAAIRHVYAKIGMVIDPHTADGFSAIIENFQVSNRVPSLLLSTAKPVKFEHTIAEALGPENVPEREERFKDMEERGQGGFDELPNDIDAVKAYIRARRFRR